MSWHSAAQALFNMGNLQRQCADFEEAINCYDAVLAIDAMHWRSLLNKAVALIGLHRSEEAQAALRQAFKLSGVLSSGEAAL